MRAPGEVALLRPIVRPGRFAATWWAVVVAAVAALVVLRPRFDVASPGQIELGFWLFAALVVFWDLRPIVTSGGYDPQGVHLSTAFVFAVLLRWGLAPTLVILVAATLSGELARGKPLFKAIYNVAQYTLSWVAAWGVLRLAGVEASLTDPAVHTAADLPVVLAAAVAYHLVNLVLVGIILSARSRRPVLVEIFDDFAFYSLTTGVVLAVAPILVALAQVDSLLVVLMVPPLLAVQRTAEMSVLQEHLSQHDALTGLPNRKRLEHVVDAAIHGRARPTAAALLLLDLDRFKQVNDTLGHQVGDELLVQVAHRLREGMRDADVVGRLGGDEFAVWVGAADRDEALQAAHRIRARLHVPFELSTMVVDVGASVGIARFPADGATLDDLLRCADVAMYGAKESRGGVEVYDRGHDPNTVSRLELVADLRRGVSAGQLVLHYQPKVAFTDRAIVGVEALVRWEHPEQGLLFPEEFLGLAEQAGLMREVTDAVVAAALAQAARWRDQDLAVPVAINISLRDLADARFVEALSAGMRAHRLDPRLVCLEVTERTLMDMAAVEARLSAIRALGVTLSLDDFGTGYSSLAHLRHLPITELKVAGVFVAEVHGNDSFVRSIVQLGHTLGLLTVAEGVETVADWHRLRALGCDMAQGYLLSAPLEADEATRCLQRGRIRDFDPARSPDPV